MVISNADIFHTVPQQDHLEFFPHNRLQSKGVVDFLRLKKEDVSRATGVPSASVRYDEKMSEELHERISEWANLLNLVAEHFKGDPHKTASWFTMTNPLLGNISPRDMIRFGRYKKLLKFIVNALADNKP
jgi:uncharacterized protein (DUF2384 family)